MKTKQNLENFEHDLVTLIPKTADTIASHFNNRQTLKVQNSEPALLKDIKKVKTNKLLSEFYKLISVQCNNTPYN